MQEKEEIILFCWMITVDRTAMAMIYTRFIRINKKAPLLRPVTQVSFSFTKVSFRTTPERDLLPINYPSSLLVLSFVFVSTFDLFPSFHARPSVLKNSFFPYLLAARVNQSPQGIGGD
jgi:hypothetical protein